MSCFSRAVVGLSLLILVACGGSGSRRAAESTGRRAEASLSRRTMRDADIAFYQGRVARDPHGARDRAMLGALYLARARSDGAESDIIAAEQLARESLHQRGKRNTEALGVLISALMAEHDFVAAHAAASTLVGIDSSAPARATLGEVALELGRYDEAGRLFGALGYLRTDPAIAPRYARWLELTGQPWAARELLRETRGGLDGGFRIPPEQLAWFDLRMGELAFKNGRPDLAGADFQRGLRLVPDDAHLLTAEARRLASVGRPAEAARLADSSLAIRFDPMTLSLRAELAEAAGDSTGAEESARALEASVSMLGSGFHRGWALFLLDHDRRPGEMLDRALQDLRTRRDVYGYDLAAWALYHAGRDREALALVDSALQQGTREALFHYHAGRIALACGDSTRARLELGSALAINPHFHLRQAVEAAGLRRTLGAEGVH